MKSPAQELEIGLRRRPRLNELQKEYCVKMKLIALHSGEEILFCPINCFCEK